MFPTNNFRGSINDSDLRYLTKLVYDYSGINLSAEKKIFIERKLNRRLSELGLETYRQYFDFLYIEENQNNEMVFLINELTTNKTDFFRESAHFDFIKNLIVPSYFKNEFKHAHLNVNVWSAGCSTGEEPYTLAIVFNELLNEYANLTSNIYASDISTEVLKKAKNAVYKMDQIEDIPIDLKKKYFLKSKDPNKGLVKVIGNIRSKIKFFRANLLEGNYGLPCKMDLIFCRNVLIYFDKTIQHKVLVNLLNNLAKGGYLFLGHSETIMGITLPIEKVAPTIYRKLL